MAVLIFFAECVQGTAQQKVKTRAQNRFQILPGASNVTIDAHLSQKSREMECPKPGDPMPIRLRPPLASDHDYSRRPEHAYRCILEPFLEMRIFRRWFFVTSGEMASTCAEQPEEDFLQHCVRCTAPLATVPAGHARPTRAVPTQLVCSGLGSHRQ